ncbi:MAG: transcriptional repressor [Sulfurospirillaceae bacterium]|nr:transcriptional repressor [Sulfurospirillaceae bacterium]
MIEKFHDVLKANNLKSTHQRLAILNCIDMHGHIDIDAIYEHIHLNYPSMSKATLYRNINDLVTFHILEEVKLPHQKQQYEIKKVPHIHLLCQECSGVEDIFIETKPLLEAVTLQSGFTISNSFIVMNGTCRVCSHKNFSSIS